VEGIQIRPVGVTEAVGVTINGTGIEWCSTRRLGARSQKLVGGEDSTSDIKIRIES